MSIRKPVWVGCSVGPRYTISVEFNGKIKSCGFKLGVPPSSSDLVAMVRVAVERLNYWMDVHGREASHNV